MNIDKDQSREIYAILDAREKRAEMQNQLIKKYGKTLVSARVNYPGINKDNDITRGIMHIISKELCDRFNNVITYEMLEYTKEGPCLTFISDMEAAKVKSIAVEIEEQHPLGRLADIDVYSGEGLQLSRTEFGISPRKCYLCGDAAHNCARSQKHNISEIINYIETQYKEYEKIIR